MKKVTSDDIKFLLDQKYHNPQKAMVAFEVANGTGMCSDRRADAISFEFWPSKGLSLTGYEFKVSRSDWLNELKQPEKSQAISQYCDHWYLVAPKDILKIDELPKGWGYIQATTKSLITKIAAPERDSIEIDRVFAASFIRKIIEKYNDSTLLKKIKAKSYENAKDDISSDMQYQVDRANRNMEEHKKVIDGFFKITGIHMSEWNYEGTASAIKALTDGATVDRMIKDFERQTSVRARLAQEAEETLAALKEWKEMKCKTKN